jgi:enoyl-CoA hydratase
MISSQIADQNRTDGAMYPDGLGSLRDLTLSSFAREIISPLAPIHALVLTGTLLEQLCDAPDRAAIALGLATLPCPIIGIRSDHPNQTIYDVCDVVTSAEFETAAILANINRSPIAATILVQVLRATPTLSVADGLKLESLAYGTLQAGREFKAWLGGHTPGEKPPVRESGLPVLVERRGGRLELRLNRPARLNALSVELRDALCEALQLALTDATIGTVAISGEGRCFTIGGDLDEFGSAPDPATAHAIRSVRQPALFLSQCADRAEFTLHGACIGAGIELPAFGRRVVAAKNSFFQLPELQFGLIPGAGGCVSIPRRIGRQRTAYLALSARRIGAAKALEWGLIDALSD